MKDMPWLSLSSTSQQFLVCNLSNDCHFKSLNMSQAMDRYLQTYKPARANRTAQKWTAIDENMIPSCTTGKLGLALVRGAFLFGRCPLFPHPLRKRIVLLARASIPCIKPNRLSLDNITDLFRQSCNRIRLLNKSLDAHTQYLFHSFILAESGCEQDFHFAVDLFHLKVGFFA